MGWSLKQMLTPPKSIRKFQPKKVGNISWWKDLGKEVGIPAAAALSGAGLVGMGPLSGLLGGVGSSLGGAASSLAGKAGSFLGGGGGLSGFLGGNGNGKFDLGDVTGFLGGNAGKLLGAGIGGKMMWDASKQSQKDQQMARQLAQRSLDMYQQAAQGAQNRYNINSPLRDAFRQTAFNFTDPSNPFSRNPAAAAGIAPQFEGQYQPPPQVPMGAQPIPVGGGSNPAMNPLLAMIGRVQGGRVPGPTPTMRAASVKAPMVAQAQDQGREQMV